MDPRALAPLLLLLCTQALMGQWIRSYTTGSGDNRVERLANGDALFHPDRGPSMVRATPNGNIVWDRNYGVAIQAVAEQASGALVALCVVPHSTLPGLGHPAIMFLDAQGQATAPLKVIDVDVQGYHWFDLALAPNGNIIVSTHNGSGAGSVHAFDANGSHLWSRNGNGRTPSRTVCGSDGSIYGVYGPLLMKWSATGDLLWRKSISLSGSSLVLWDIIITGGIPVALALHGVTGQLTRPALVMFSTDGAVSNAVTWELAQFEHSASYLGFSGTPNGAIAIAASFTSNTPVVQRGALITTYVDPVIANTRCEEVDLGYTTLHDVATSDGDGCYVMGYSTTNGTQAAAMLMRTNSSWWLGDCARQLQTPLNILLAPVMANSTGQLPLPLTANISTRPVVPTVGTHTVYPVCGAGDRSAINLRVMLGGPYDTNTGTMRGDLRNNGMVPLTEPYTALGYTSVGAAGGITTPYQLGFGDAQAVLDWIFVELLEPNGNVVSTRTALVRRNGTVTMPHGSATVVFHVPAGNYHVRVRHRNHLAAVTATPIALGASAVLDLTTSPTYGIEAQRTVNGVAMLWPGDVNGDGIVKYTGLNNDRDPVLVAIGGTVATNTVSGWYTGEDVNMDGVIKYTGPNNDRDIILQTIGGVIATHTRQAQSP